MGVVDWTELHPDMLTLVGEYLTHVNDHLTFSMVCSSWRSVAVDLRHSLPLRVPLLMLPGDDNPNLQTRYYFSLSDQKTIEKKTSFPHDDVCVGSQGGWLVIVHKNLEMSIFNPLSGERFSLPSITSMPKLDECCIVVDNDNFVETCAFSSNDMRGSPKDLIVMIVQGGRRQLAFAKSGDTHWHVMDNDQYSQYTSIVFYKGKFYATGERGTVVCKIGSNPQTTLAAPALPPAYIDPTDFVCYKWYLLESLGELILVSRWLHMYDDHADNAIDDRSVLVDFGLPHQVMLPRENLGDSFKTYKTVYFTVYKLDFPTEEWIQMKNLSDQTFFLGRNTSFSLKGSGNKDCKSNCIYFTEDYIDGEGCARIHFNTCYGHDMGVFDMIDGSINPLFNSGVNAYYPAPTWVIHRPW